jgi:HAD superfamily hydrolase (TIGR01490 family)
MTKSPSGIAFFDLDCTLLSIDSYRTLLKSFYLSNLSWRIFPFLYFSVLRKFRIISHLRFKEKSLFPFLGWTNDQIHTWGDNFFHKFLKQNICLSGSDKVKYHLSENHKVCIATGAPDIYLTPIKNIYGNIDIICTSLEYRNNIFTGRIIPPDCLGVGKLHYAESYAVSKKIDKSDCWFYSDHISDLPLLEWVGHPNVINPSSELMKIAIQQKWPILSWD